jgi:hypothetical protein
MNIEIFNEDGSIYDPPRNPLEDKWRKLYPPIPMPQHSQVCDGYSCMWCNRCPEGDDWKVPEEDKEVWEQYQEQIREYDRVHNPILFEWCNI